MRNIFIGGIIPAKIMVTGGEIDIGFVENCGMLEGSLQ
jgi:hypothetical protein